MLGMDAVLKTTALSTEARARQDLRARYEREAPHASFKDSVTNIVWGDGPGEADLMFIGEAPGRDEDLSGVPFVGRAGQLLDKMIIAMGFCRGDQPGGVYIANVLKTRPPNNATPTTAEAQACAPYLYEQIAIVQPRVIVTLGLPATHLILNTTAALGQLRGHWAAFEDAINGREVGKPGF